MMVINSSIIRGVLAQAKAMGGFENPVQLDNVQNNLEAKGLFYPMSEAAVLFHQLAENKHWKNIGIEIGRKMQPYQLGLLGYYLHSCNHLFVAHEKLGQYQMLISDVANFYFKVIKNEIHWYLTSPYSSRLEDNRLKKTIVDFEMAFRHSVLEKLLSKKILPLKIELIYDETEMERKKIHSDFFQCPVVYDSPFNKIVYAFADVNSFIPSANKEVFDHLEILIKNILQKVQGQGNYTLLVRRIIRSNIGLFSLSLENVAKKINMSSRNLQRQLKAEETSFQDILNDEQKEVTFTYKNKGNTPGEIAHLLGYRETNSFLRAFKRWYGTSFSNYKV